MKNELDKQKGELLNEELDLILEDHFSDEEEEENEEEDQGCLKVRK